jgi:cytochrome oxidase Cu insertion factor (SCO1/SenC/PrrC family)
VIESGAGLWLGPALRCRAPALIAAILLSATLAGVAIAIAVNFLVSKPAPVLTARRPYRALAGQATWPAGAREAPPINTLRDQTGHRFSLSSLRGHTVAIVFFDSHCHQQCPLEGRALATAERALPRSQRPVFVAVSVNPLDTPASAHAAVRAWGLAQVAPWRWLLGDHAQLAPVWRAYRILVAPPAKGDISHTEALYLVDRRGDERSGYLYPFVPRFVTHDLRVLAVGRGNG